MTDTVPNWKEGLDRDKLEATALYLLRGCAPMRPGLTSLVKMIWFADFGHYRKHLSPITGAKYVALERGPVLHDYEVIFGRLVDEGILDKTEVDVQGHTRKKIEYIPKLQPDEDLFTETELDVLNEVIEECGRIPGATLSSKTDREGPWALIWNSSDPGRHIPYVAFRWLDNLPDEEDLEEARKVLARPGLAEHVAELNQQN